MSARWWRLAVAAAIVSGLTACSGSAGRSTGPGAGSAPLVNTDNREALMSVLGPPDAFTKKIVQVEGGPDATMESFVYAALAHRYDMVDGLVVGDEAIDPFPDGTVLPKHITYYDVNVGAPAEDVRKAMTPIELTQTDGAALGMPAGAVVLTGGQLMVVLVDDKVVYAQTYPLVPDPSGELQAYLDGSEP